MVQVLSTRQCASVVLLCHHESTCHSVHSSHRAHTRCISCFQEGGHLMLTSNMSKRLMLSPDYFYVFSMVTIIYQYTHLALPRGQVFYTLIST